MLIIDEWGQDFNIPYHMLLELKRRLGRAWQEQPEKYATPSGQPGSESRQQSLMFLEASRHPDGILMFRNNVGAYMDKGGRLVRYGLANESEKQNKVFKSADGIGLRKVLIQPWHVGRVIGQFVSREMKKEDWVHTGDEHELAQDNWADLINAYGGDARYATGEGSF